MIPRPGWVTLVWLPPLSDGRLVVFDPANVGLAYKALQQQEDTYTENNCQPNLCVIILMAMPVRNHCVMNECHQQNGNDLKAVMFFEFNWQ